MGEPFIEYFTHSQYPEGKIKDVNIGLAFGQDSTQRFFQAA